MNTESMWRSATDKEKSFLTEAKQSSFEIILGPNTNSYWIYFEKDDDVLVTGWFDTEEEAMGFVETKGYLHADCKWLVDPDMDI